MVGVDVGREMVVYSGEDVVQQAMGTEFLLLKSPLL
jgi:hypothetical protein